MQFGEFVRTKARARGDVAGLVGTIRGDKKVTNDTKLVNAKKKFGTDPNWETLVKRYNAHVAKVSKKR